MLREEYRHASDQQAIMEIKVKKSHAISMDLLNKLSYIDFYVPAAGDAIDARLADFVNSSFFRVELKALFRKLVGGGNYKFGVMNVVLSVGANLYKTEGGATTNLMVSTGKEVMPITDFVEIYLPIQLEETGINPMEDYVTGITYKKLNTAGVKRNSIGKSSPNTRKSTQMR
jgi:hypothetical protein